MYYRYGHVDNVKVKVGDKVKKGQRIADNGTGNGQWPAHCHFDILGYKPTAWTEYVIGRTKEWVKEHYANPTGLEKVVLPTFDHYGYKWLDFATYSGGTAWHPGLDLNGKGSGNDDIGDPIFSACDGVVVYVYSGTGKNAGWGDLIVIEEKVSDCLGKLEQALKDQKQAEELAEEAREECAKLQKQLDKIEEAHLKELLPAQQDIEELKSENAKLKYQVDFYREHLEEDERKIEAFNKQINRLEAIQTRDIQNTTIPQAFSFLLSVITKK